MKNILIAILTTYVFYTDLCVVKLWYVVPLIFVTFWLIIAGIDELIRDFQHQVKRGQRLQAKLRKAERSW